MNANDKSHTGEEQNIDLNDKKKKKKIAAPPNRHQFWEGLNGVIAFTAND